MTAADILAIIRRAYPDIRTDDIGYVLGVTDTVVSESSRIVARPATDEELAKIEVARRIDVAAKIACDGASRREVG